MGGCLHVRGNAKLWLLLDVGTITDAAHRVYLNSTFAHTGMGLGIITIAARQLHASGWSYRLMATNPWIVFGVGLAASIGSLIATRATDPANYVQKYACWTLFNLSQAALLTPLMFLQPALLARAGLYTVGMMGSIAFVGATAKQEKYLYLGAPLYVLLTYPQNWKC
jgi:FtsH-binding integral membrane protein